MQQNANAQKKGNKHHDISYRYHFDFQGRRNLVCKFKVAKQKMFSVSLFQFIGSELKVSISEQDYQVSYIPVSVRPTGSLVGW